MSIIIEKRIKNRFFMIKMQKNIVSANPVNKRLCRVVLKNIKKSLKNLLTNYRHDDIITKSSVRHSNNDTEYMEYGEVPKWS